MLLLLQTMLCVHRLALRVLLLEHLEHFGRDIFSAERAIVWYAIFLKVENVLFRFSKAARMHPFLARSFTLEHLLDRVVVVFVVRFSADAIKLITGYASFGVFVAFVQNESRIISILRRNKVNALLLPVDILISVNFVIFWRLRTFAKSKLDRVDFVHLDCVEIDRSVLFSFAKWLGWAVLACCWV